ncbi:MAG: sigma-54 dependent transcriptional regulator [Deltaproteobacteria bacterium]
MRILVIDDEEAMRHMLGILLKREGWDYAAFDDASKALSALENDDFDFVLCDIKMPGLDGYGFLKALKERSIGKTVIMMSAYGTMDSAIECMKLGAYDYISKPFKSDEVIITLKKALERERLKSENARLKAEVSKEYAPASIITRDAAMSAILDLVRKVADYDSPVLITGESGTGKELVARALHYRGCRADGPFVAVNCGAIPAQLLESELFGHVKGAFTDAHRAKQGLFHEANEGTIFLDEIGELPHELQVKLLRVLQEGEVRRVGDTRSVKIDARVVAATIRDLKAEVEKGSFREDLYYRLNVIDIKVPPLRKRKADIIPLATHFIEKYAKMFGKPLKSLSEEALRALEGYEWPGNVRELENAIERAMILEDTPMIRGESLPVYSHAGTLGRQGPDDDLSIKKASESIERELIKKALEKTHNNKTRAALLLEISHRALLYKIKSYGLDRP